MMQSTELLSQPLALGLSSKGRREEEKKKMRKKKLIMSTEVCRKAVSLNIIANMTT